MARSDESGVLPLADVEDEWNDAPPEGFLDSLAQRFGAAPWWTISGTFHGLMMLLLMLVGMVIYHAKPDNLIVTTLVHSKPPIYDPPPKVQPDLHKVKYEVDQPPTDLHPVLLHEVAVSETIETPDEAETHEARGEPDMISDVDLSSHAVSAAIGTSGPGGGRFGTRGLGKARKLREGGGGPNTENAKDRALRWLAKHQEADGRWDVVKYGGKQADVGVTGLALLAFLGGGHTERVGAYKDHVKRATAWLRSVQRDDGAYFKQGETHGVGYHHGIAGLAMAEAAGMGRDRNAPTWTSAQKAVDYSLAHQCGEGSDKLGFRYDPKQAGDLSVTGWFVMQLKSAKMANLGVDPAAFEGAIRFLDSVEAKGGAGETYGGHRYGYRDAQSVSHRRTAIGVLCRQFLGWDRAELQGGVEWYIQNGGVPSWNGNGGDVDLYYWYYGALSTFQQDGPNGPIWQKWNEGMKKALLENQRIGGDEDGSWDPVGAYAGYWGRVGQTALGALCLEVYYRYNLMAK